MGSWGTTLAIHLARTGSPVLLWGRDPEQRKRIAADRENRKYLPGHRFPGSLRVASQALPENQERDPVILAIPSHGVRGTLRQLPGARSRVWILASKGIEESTGLRMSEVFAQECGVDAGPLAILTGPSLAREVAEGKPAAVLIASREPDAARDAQELLSSERFRVYTSDDVIGVEIAGALKNVIALAAGIADGLELGQNARGALLTRGLAEMRRLGEALGARPETFLGLSGMGDLVTTCTSPLSRNHTLGELLGRGVALEQALARSVMVAEGVRTTRAALDLAARVGVEMPIATQVARILFEGVDARVALRELMTRPLRQE
ncbi:MAG: NAD(P)-dependent glycerol-3-phosphate dehydrogenase [Candidatus Eisenbacteria bacterium]|nr:NAD(P)-dependent glycerol-3-phosphate dehydrogenase [Candidatus Eisenbacteria bacterium]